MSEPAKPIALTVDGKPVTVPEGTTVLQACEKAGLPAAGLSRPQDGRQERR